MYQVYGNSPCKYLYREYPALWEMWKGQSLHRALQNLRDTSRNKRGDIIPPKGSRQQTSTPSMEKVEHVNVSTEATKTPNGVALATAIAMLQLGTQSREVRFFGIGSQRTFITKKLVQQSGLTTKQTKTMTLTGFMDHPTTQEFDIVKPVIQMVNHRKRINAVVVEQLPRTIVTAGMTDAMQHLIRKGIILADPNIQNDTIGPVDLLIGVDYYYDFISPHSIMYDGVRLLESTSGYIITGNISVNYKPALPTTSSEHVTPEDN